MSKRKNKTGREALLEYIGAVAKFTLSATIAIPTTAWIFAKMLPALATMDYGDMNPSEILFAQGVTFGIYGVVLSIAGLYIAWNLIGIAIDLGFGIWERCKYAANS